jgi:hypothetical protein
MEAPLDVDAKRGESDHSHKRSGLEKAADREVVSGGDATKTPREGNNDHHAVEMEDEDEEEEMGPYGSLRSTARSGSLVMARTTTPPASTNRVRIFFVVSICSCFSSESSPSCCLISLSIYMFS